MARFIDISLPGFEDVMARLRALPGAIQNRVIRPGLRAGAKEAAARARALAPRGEGRLGAGNWKVRAMRASTQRARKAVGYRALSPTRQSLRIKPGRTWYYPYSQEFGWMSGRRAILGSSRLLSVLTPSTRRAIEAQHAKTSRRRKIPGKRFMQKALLGSPDTITAAVAREMLARMDQFDSERAAEGDSDGAED